MSKTIQNLGGLLHLIEEAMGDSEMNQGSTPISPLVGKSGSGPLTSNCWWFESTTQPQATNTTKQSATRNECTTEETNRGCRFWNLRLLARSIVCEGIDTQICITRWPKLLGHFRRMFFRWIRD